MKILVATDGQIDAKATADLVSRLAGPGDTVSVLTVIDHPGEVLRSFADAGLKGIDEILGETGPGAMGFGSGTATAEHLKQREHSQRGHAEPLDKYFEDTANRDQKELIEAFAAVGVEAEAMWRATERKTARTILDTVERQAADILVLGSHGRGRFEGLLGSTGTKLVRLATIPVLLVKPS